MARWKRGEATIERLLAEGALDAITRSVSDGAAVLEQAKLRLKVVEGALAIGPDGRVPSAYDAARLAATAVSAQQGLRPTRSGGHRAVEDALLSQFGAGFSKFAVLRRRHHELDYPSSSYSEASDDEALDAVSTARSFVETAAKLLPTLGFLSDWPRAFGHVTRSY